jgi:hypothetical protein
MGNFQVCDALSILFKLEKPLVEHLEGFILLPIEGDELENFFRTLNRKFQLNIGSAKARTSMVGETFAVAIISC